eukprot:CAMPEP_0170777352 /NCGR_PEP_ID=MMETSP0733-20121128/11730_1 /TAXON_ID=186038 /ORGANISM="Fragilariopsis kerguelensis, Strain L26-C5" /LENGTH=551 /DNA_ID=CAMNT_0011120539 /DNA_START=16 /DNA_END=1671 /DNA_ORIENTATION=+
MTMTSSAVTVNAAVKERVLSWLHDDEALVTSQRIQQECRKYDDENDSTEGQALSRYEGSQLLNALFVAGEEEISQEDSHGNISSNKYIATLCTIHEYTTPVILDDNMWEDGGGGEKGMFGDGGGGMDNTDEYKTTEYNLIPSRRSKKRSSPNNDDDDVQATEDTVVALKLRHSLDPLDSVHEQDMSFLRDQITDDNIVWYYDQDLSRIRPTPRLGTMDSKPAAPVVKTWHKRVKQCNQASSINRTTTAKAFFVGSSGKNNNNKNTSTASTNGGDGAGGAEKKKADTTTTKNSSSRSRMTSSSSSSSNDNKNNHKKSIFNNNNNEKSNKQKTVKKIPSAFVKRTRPAKASSKSSTTTTTTTTTSRNKNKKQKDNDNDDTDEKMTVGTADDFVGDKDEDSDDEVEMTERREKSKEIIRKQVVQDEMVDAVAAETDKDMEDDDPVIKRGAMDAFTTKKTIPKSTSSGGGGSKTKKRKILRDKTTMNSSGFLITTTEEVWEEIVVEDEDTAVIPAAAKKSSSNKPKQMIITKKKTNGSDMKQGSISGFFAVKKKK